MAIHDPRKLKRRAAWFVLLGLVFALLAIVFVPMKPEVTGGMSSELVSCDIVITAGGTPVLRYRGGPELGERCIGVVGVVYTSEEQGIRRFARFLTWSSVTYRITVRISWVPEDPDDPANPTEAWICGEVAEMFSVPRSRGMPEALTGNLTWPTEFDTPVSSTVLSRAGIRHNLIRIAQAISVIGLLLALIMSIVTLVRLRSIRHSDVLPLCPKCGYSLKGTADRSCPECGWGRTGDGESSAS